MKLIVKLIQVTSSIYGYEWRTRINKNIGDINLRRAINIGIIININYI